MKKRHLNGHGSASYSKHELEADLKKCGIMGHVSSNAVGRKAFAKRALKVPDELPQRAEQLNSE